MSQGQRRASRARIRSRSAVGLFCLWVALPPLTESTSPGGSMTLRRAQPFTGWV